MIMPSVSILPTHLLFVICSSSMKTTRGFEIVVANTPVHIPMHKAREGPHFCTYLTRMMKLTSSNEFEARNF